MTMRITHWGHACLTVATEDGTVLLDPGTLSSGFEGERGLDAVLVTHEHPDHLDVPRVAALLEANAGCALYADAGSAALLGDLGVRVVAPGDVVSVGRGLTVTVGGGIHEPVYGDVPGIPNNSYLLGDGLLFHPGDSYALPGRPVEVLALPTSGPWLRVRDAVEHVRAVRPRVAVPMHEAALADTTTHYELIGLFCPEGTAFTPLERGRPTTVPAP